MGVKFGENEDICSEFCFIWSWMKRMFSLGIRYIKFVGIYATPRRISNGFNFLYTDRNRIAFRSDLYLLVRLSVAADRNFYDSKLTWFGPENECYWKWLGSSQFFTGPLSTCSLSLNSRYMNNCFKRSGVEYLRISHPPLWCFLLKKKFWHLQTFDLKSSQ